jgi:hypothetical protein
MIHTTETINKRSINVYAFNNARWFLGSEIGLLFGYKRPGNAIKAHVIDDHKMTIGEYHELICNDEKDKITHPDTYSRMLLINEEGLKTLIIKSRLPGSIRLAKQLNISITNEKILYKEQETLNCIKKAFKNLNMLFQYHIGIFKIDLYFIDYNLAIECDELGHTDRDLIKELNRQAYIEKELKCKFIRYNPDVKDFDIFDVINTIFIHIQNCKLI